MRHPVDSTEHAQTEKPTTNVDKNEGGKDDANLNDKAGPANQGQTTRHAKQDSGATNGTRKAPGNGAEGSHDAHFANSKNAPEKAEDPKTEQDMPRTKRKRQEERTQKNRKRAKVAPSAYSRRDDAISRPQPEAPRSPSPIRRSPSPDAAPVRQRKRPGGGARVSAAALEAVRRRQEEREKQQQLELKQGLHDRGVHDVVRQHYNMVPERGREWRKTDSKIKGLRSFNNWVKSTLIQKFSPDEDFLARFADNGWASQAAPPPPDEEPKRLLVIDLGCGKGGDLFKWNQAPQPVDLYVGLDPAEVSIEQARDRYLSMRNQRGRRRGSPLFHAEFYPKDCFGEWLGDVPIVQRVGIDANVGPEGSLMASRWSSGGFDVVVCMFTMHYAFENEKKARQMLSNVAGVLKKGGRFIGVGPNSDVISDKVAEFHRAKKAKEAAAKENQGQAEEGEVSDLPETPEWGNKIYRVRFPGDTPEDGIFRPPFGWKYSYFMEEAVEEIPEYVVPWEAFRAYVIFDLFIFMRSLTNPCVSLAEDFNLEMQYRKPFLDIWESEKDDSVLGPLSERMGVRSRTDGSLLVSDEELEAASMFYPFLVSYSFHSGLLTLFPLGFYHGFCFYKV